MKDQIRLYLISITLLCLAVLLVFSAVWVDGRLKDTTTESLENYLESAKAAAPDDYATDPERANAILAAYSSDVQVVLTNAAGEVLFAANEDEVDLAAIENARAALRNGESVTVWKSETTGVRNVHAVGPFGENDVVVFSASLSGPFEFFVSTLPVLVGLLLLVFLLTGFLSNRLTKRIMRPYDEMVNHIKTMVDNEEEPPDFEPEFPELNSVFAYYKHLTHELKRHINQLSTKNTQIEVIMNSMEEGLALLDDDFNILLANDRCYELLAIPHEHWQKNITYLYRVEKFSKALDQVKQSRERKTLDLPAEGGRIFRFFIGPAGDDGFIVLVGDITDIVRLENMRSDFVSNVSHELKTPVAAISGYAELVKDGDVGDPQKVKEYADKIFDESARLMRLLDDTLNLSELEKSQGDEFREPVDMREVFSFICDKLGKSIAEKQIRVIVEGECVLLAGRERMEELALNLVDNAVRYNVAGGSIRIVLREAGFSVADTGIGIPKDHLPRLFERFYRVDAARSRKTGGTGLGLSIVKHVAELYGGTAKAESSPNGTTFFVEFPEDLVPGANAVDMGK